MEEYTFVLCTRLKRKIFADKAVARRMSQLVTEAMPSGVYLHEFCIFPSAFAFTASVSDGISLNAVSYAVRKATSAKIRGEFNKYHKMPSLWQRKFAITDKCAKELDGAEIDSLFLC